MADITIGAELAVINGFVRIPGGEILAQTRLTPDAVLALIPGSTLFRMGRGGDSNLPASTYTVQSYTETSRQQDQLWILLPPYKPDVGFNTDWYHILRAAVGLS